MYHALEDQDHPAGYTDSLEQFYVLQTDSFLAQMQYLRDNGFQAYLFEELFTFDYIPDNAIVITFDDGHVSAYHLVLPILQELRLKAEFFITTNWIDTPRFLSKSQIKSISEAGMGIGSHGTTHSYLDDLSPDQIMDELLRSREQLQLIVAKSITAISLPGGRCPIHGTANILNLYNFCFTSRPGLQQSMDCRVVPRIAIHRNTHLSTFERIVRRDRTFYFTANLRSKTLHFIKNALGNRRYEALHRMWQSNRL